MRREMLTASRGPPRNLPDLLCAAACKVALATGSVLLWWSAQAAESEDVCNEGTRPPLLSVSGLRWRPVRCSCHESTHQQLGNGCCWWRKHIGVRL